MPGPLPTVWLGGLCNLDEAKVPVMDRGFLFGDGVYELLPVYSGVPFRERQHLERLARSLRETGIANPHTLEGWSDLIAKLVDANGNDNVTVYLQVTRGAPVNRDHAFPGGDVEPTVFAMCAQLPAFAPQLRSNGVAMILREDTRWGRCDIKATSLLANVMLRQESAEHGAAETVLYRGDQVIEGSASSVFAVIGGRILTPPDGPEILPGTTRDLVMELAHNAGLPAAYEPVSVDAFRGADEVWVCSSVREVLPVTMLDGAPVGDGNPGPVWKKIDGLFRDYKQRVIAGRAA